MALRRRARRLIAAGACRRPASTPPSCVAAMDEIDRIRSCAEHSVGRAFLFALLAIGAVVMGLVGWAGGLGMWRVRLGDQVWITWRDSNVFCIF